MNDTAETEDILTCPPPPSAASTVGPCNRLALVSDAQPLESRYFGFILVDYQTGL